MTPMNRLTSRNSVLLVLALLAAALTLFSPAKAFADNEGEALLSNADRARLTYFYLAAQQKKADEEYTSAAQLLQHCLQINPNDAASCYDLALIHFSLGQDNLALPLLKKAISNDPKNPWYLETLASVYLTTRKTDEAVPVLEQLASLQTKRTDVLVQLIQIYKSKGRTQDAINTLDRIQTLQGNNTQIASQKYALYIDLGDTVKALNQLKQLCEEFPYDATSLLLLGDQYMDVGLADSATIVYDKVEHIDPHNVMLQASRLQYHLLMGDTLHFRTLRDSIILDRKADPAIRINGLGSLARDAIRDSTQRAHAESIFANLLADEKPAISTLQVYMAYKTYSENATFEQLLPYMERILEIDPSEFETIRQLLAFYAKQNDAKRVGEICQRALIYHPGEMVFHYFLGMSYAQQDKTQEAINSLHIALRQLHDNTPPDVIGDVYAMLGDLEHQLGHETEAFAAYDSCLVYSPDNASCLNNYAYYLSLHKDQLARAEEMSYRSIKIEPDNKTFLDTYAWVLYTQDDYTTARIYMDRVVEPAKADSSLLADDNISATLFDHAGDIYLKCGQPELANRFWQLALTKSTDKKMNATIRKKLKKNKKSNHEI